MFSELALLLIGLYILYRWLKPELPPNFPPGPANYPVVGGAPTLTKLDPVLGNSLIKLGKIYGPVTGIYLGKNLGVIVNGFEAVKQVLTRDVFNDRPDTFNSMVDIIDPGRGKGIMFNNGESWKEQRRFTLRHLRDLGFGKSSLEGVIHEEIRELLARLANIVKQSDPKKGIFVDQLFGVSIINVLWHVVSGKRFNHDDKEFQVILEKLTLSFRSGSPAASLIADYTFLRHFPYFKGIWRTAVGGVKSITGLLKDSIAQHKQARKENVNNHDFIFEYLRQLEEVKGSTSPVGKLYSEAELTICSDLFAAGAESTSNSLAFAMLYMVLYPEVQARVQAEIDSVVQKDRLPSLNDKSGLPYTEAVLEELFRLTSIAPLTVQHAVTETTDLYGYTIPKGALVMVNLHSVHMDKEHWGDPQSFRPDRFMDGARFVKSERVMTFGLGKRICPGESLARMNYYLFFTAIMQAYTLELVPGTAKPSTVPLPGFTIAPQPFKARFVSRK